MKNEIRLTPQRKVILEALHRDKTHPTADEIYQRVRNQMPRISLGTVYRNLELMSREGLIRKLEYGGGQKRFDGRCDPHYHVRCVECGCLSDIESFKEPSLEFEFSAPGFDIWGHHLEFYGLCPLCRDVEAKTTKKKSGFELSHSEPHLNNLLTD